MGKAIFDPKNSNPDVDYDYRLGTTPSGGVDTSLHKNGASDSEGED